MTPFALCWTIKQVPQALVLDVEDIVEAGQRGDDVAVLLVEVLEGGIFMEDVHALPLREDHPDWAVLEHQPRFTSQENTHLLVEL